MCEHYKFYKVFLLNYTFTSSRTACSYVVIQSDNNSTCHLLLPNTADRSECRHGGRRG